MQLKLHKSSGHPMFWRHTHVIFALKGWPSLPSENNGSLDPSTFNQQRRLFVEKLLLFFCRTRRVVGSSDASPLFGDPIWHFGNVRRGNRISGSHSRQQEITTSRREMTWNDSKPLGPSGQTSKSCLLQSFEFIVEEHQRQKKRHNFFEAQNVFYYIEIYFKKNMSVQLHLFWRLATMATVAWWSFLRF